MCLWSVSNCLSGVTYGVPWRLQRIGVPEVDCGLTIELAPPRCPLPSFPNCSPIKRERYCAKHSHGARSCVRLCSSAGCPLRGRGRGGASVPCAPQLPPRGDQLQDRIDTSLDNSIASRCVRAARGYCASQQQARLCRACLSPTCGTTALALARSNCGPDAIFSL